MGQDYSEKKFSVLIADDNQNNLKVLSAMLETLGYRVRVAKSGEQTIQSVETVKPDIILLDIHMPGMDGYEVCTKLKATEEYNDIPVIFISALSEVFNKIQAFKVGGIDYITKPFELEEVQLRVETHIRLKENTLMLRNALLELQKKEELLVQSEKMAALGVLTSGIAHEINNPVNFISNSVSALEERVKSIISDKKLPDSEMNDDFNKLFLNVATGIDQITKIVHSLRLYCRIDTDKKTGADINNLIESALTIMHHRFTYRIAVEQKFSSIPEIKCQPGRISQVFINIISNSIDAIEDAIKSEIIKEDQGKITISTVSNDSHVNIKITDNGAGIDKSIIKKIFDPFFTTKAVGHGTGLGLSICQSIIKDHNGSIIAESADKNGTAIIISIPLAGV
ncbi:MAG TPA: response regulator [Spirochaetota bacterium]|nr:response regulator [Spirochaetota bacterium]